MLYYELATPNEETIAANLTFTCKEMKILENKKIFDEYQIKNKKKLNNMDEFIKKVININRKMN